MAPGQGEGRHACCGRSKGRPGATAGARGCRCGTCPRRAACWSASTSARAATSPTCARCHVLPPHVSDLLLPLRALIGSHGRSETCSADRAGGRRARDGAGAAPPGAADRRATCEAARVRRPRMACSGGCSPRGRTRCSCWMTSGARAGLRAARVRHHDAVQADRLHPGQPAHQPRAGGARAAPAGRAADERVIDWFCGLGNFTLPLATRARRGAGHRGQRGAGARARATTRATQRARPSADRASWRATCSRSTRRPGRRRQRADKWLVDPPREGAFALAKALADLQQQPALRAGWTPPQRIVYVSCNPATLARDAGLLVHQAGYRCAAAGVVNMFPHTAHVESMAVFERKLRQLRLRVNPRVLARRLPQQKERPARLDVGLATGERHACRGDLVLPADCRTRVRRGH